MKTGKLLFISLLCIGRLSAQPCGTAQGDQITYGTNDTWIGYVYNNNNFTNYYGYVIEGSPGNMNFDQGFGGDNVTYAVNGCNIQTEDFSIRYMLNKNFTDNDYTITVGGDDGYRFSIDGGVNWVLQDWGGHGYTTRQGTFRLNGSTNLVLEYFDNGAGNRVSFNICSVIDDPNVYGTNNVWRGYVYDEPGFTAFKGTVLEGSSVNPFFNQTFGGDDVTYYTNTCSINTQSFSVRYRLRKTFYNEDVTFLVGGDDGYRFSINGGANWVINNWGDHVYQTTNYSARLNGTYDLVLEYYDNNAANRVSFDMNTILLPVQLVQFKGNINNELVHLNWTTTLAGNTDHFIIEKSTDGQLFKAISQVKASAGVTNNTGIQYSWSASAAFTGTLYYRLKIVDVNGIVSYSDIITVKHNINGKISLFPTVLQASAPLMLQAGQRFENITVNLVDLMERPVLQTRIPVLPNGETTRIALPGSKLMKGIYIVQVKQGTNLLLTQKVIIQ